MIREIVLHDAETGVLVGSSRNTTRFLALYNVEAFSISPTIQTGDTGPRSCLVR